MNPTNTTGTAGFQIQNGQRVYVDSTGKSVGDKNQGAAQDYLYGNGTMAGLNQTPASGFVSSAQPTINNQTTTAVSNSTGNITGVNGGQSQTQTQTGAGVGGYSNNGSSGNGNSGNSGGSLYNQDGSYNPQGFVNYATNQIVNSAGASRDAILGSYNATIQNAALANQSLQLQYNTALGKMNQQYNQNFQQLQTQHMNSIGSAVSQMAAADPMGVNSSSFGGGYVGKINDMYGQTVTFLNSAYAQQQAALENGKAEQVIAIQGQINDANAQLGQQLANLNSTMSNALVGAQQTGVGMSQFQQSRQLQAQGIFNSQLNSMALPTDALNQSGVISGYDNNGQPQINNQLLKGINSWFTSGGQMPSGLSSDQTRALMTIINDPSFQTGLQAGYQPSQIIQQMASGSYRQQQVGLQTEANTRAWQIANAQYGIGQGGTGGGTSGGSSNLGTFGQTIMSGGGSASIIAHPEIAKQLVEMSTAASPQNIKQLTDFVNQGDLNKLAVALGGFINSVFGANLGNITSSEDLIATGATYLQKLGINTESLSNLANQSKETRAQVITGIINGIQGQLVTNASMNSKLYNLSKFAPDLDSAYTNLENAKKSLNGTSGTSSSVNDTWSAGWDSLTQAINNIGKK